MAAAAIQTLFLRDINHGGPPGQALTIAKKLATFVRGATSSVDIAIYDFRLQDPNLVSTVVGALTKAAAKGITVRIAYDAGKPANADAATFARLAADPAPPGTAQWVADHFGNSDVSIRPITAPSGQLMHSKYIIRDAALAGPTTAVWTGSTNFTDDAWTLQENNIITVSSPSLAASYRADFEQLWAAGSIKGTGSGGGGDTTAGGASVGWDFAPGDGAAIDGALAAAISGASKRIVMATMVLTSHAVLAALVAAVGRGLPLSGIYDSGQMGPIEREWAKSASSAQALADWTVVKAKLVAKKSTPFKVTSPHNFMHNKVLIADDQLITGSYNFSNNAEKNAENQLQLANDPALAAKYAKYVAALVTAYGAPPANG
jgi:phosphatidylserine/phosphatidylglycerophosphate/cardiolipin synthase-like enzyme